jgi:two-component system chemotaxis response regulator CheY
MRSIIRNLLGQIGIRQVYEAENGERALQWLSTAASSGVDAILCDLHMPGGDGMHLCVRLRRSRGHHAASVPFIIVTGETDDLVLDVVRGVGANGVLHKPFSPAQLRSTLEQAIGFSF